jgi:hypothetical protein
MVVVGSMFVVCGVAMVCLFVATARRPLLLWPFMSHFSDLPSDRGYGGIYTQAAAQAAKRHHKFLRQRNPLRKK